MYMLRCRNSQVCLDYSSNGRRNFSSHCSSGQSSTLLIDGNMTWFVTAQRKDPWTEKGERPADYLLLTKPVDQKRILGYSQFGTIRTATFISCAVTVFNLALVLITFPYTQFLTWISKYSSKCTWPLCWNRAEKSTLLWYRKLKYSKYWANFFLCHILDEYYFFFSIILGNLKSITGFEKKCVLLLLLFSPGETSSFQQISRAVLW